MEVYDADLSGLTRLSNLSTLTEVTPGSGLLIAGFVITGEGEKTVLVRGVGPSLTQFGFTSSQVLRDPRIRLFRGAQLLDQNDNWAGAPLLTSAFNAVGAFAFLDADTTDAALLLKLSAGSYSVHLESADNDSGQAIIEVYEVK